MASKELLRLRQAERDLHNWYAQYMTPQRRQATKDLKAMRTGYKLSLNFDMADLIEKDLTARRAEGKQRLEALTAELAAARDAVKAKAIRKRSPASAEAKREIKEMLQSPTANPNTIAQWIATAHHDEPEYWAAFEQVAEQLLAAAGTHPTQAKLAREMTESVKKAIAEHEPSTYTPAEAAAAHDAKEVDACFGSIQQGLKAAALFLDREISGLDGNLPRSIPRWSGLPDREHPNGLLEPGNTSIQLTDSKGNFLAPAAEPVAQEV